MSNTESFIIEVMEDGTFVLTLPDDSIRETDGLEETFDVIQTYFSNKLMQDENFLRF